MALDVVEQLLLRACRVKAVAVDGVPNFSASDPNRRARAAAQNVVMPPSIVYSEPFT